MAPSKKSPKAGKKTPKSEKKAKQKKAKTGFKTPKFLKIPYKGFKAIKEHVRKFFNKQAAVVYVKGLKYSDAVRLGGVLLSCIAMCLLMISVCTEFWAKKFYRGSFMTLGLWTECQAGKCSPRKHMPIYVIVALISMMVSAWTCFASVVFGTISLTPAANAAYPPITIYLSFVSGFAGGVGLFTFMRFSTNEANTVFGWSLIPGWLSIILVSLAGACYYVARRYEDEEAATELTTNVLLTLWEEDEGEAETET